MTLFKNKYRIETTRLKNWNYTSTGWYFITICTRQRQHFFGQVLEADVRLTEIGEIAAQFWRDIPSHFLNAALDEFIIMPNHLHGIVVLSVETRHVASLPNDTPPQTTANQFGPLKRGSVSKIIQAYKAAVTTWCRKNQHPEFDWQPRFYDHIIRNEKSLTEIRQYILNNPLKWELDRENQEGLWM